ncbi:probable protein phosphatase 2C 75 [Cynara cardunculus var. scolymus]|uniref:protein-serine/threonine phosphatase n=1 Tax=Cynara cardunculus var. scolymus TaxID=59895 RepID=A0A103Y920_CYNCS|nr:probable protein phosphatase 2C 75 [Cynara cardunculus var. scolymus]KVI04767.1 Protein phosphatase 2C [Cynara cardunculus var. scolymus]
MKRVYGSRKSVMVSNEDEDSSVKCRERRRRRIAIRRMAAVAADASGSSLVVGENEGQKDVAKTTSGDKPTTSITAASIMSLINIMETPPPPVYGMMSVIGRQREMEDEVSVKTNLCRPEINGFRPVHFFGVFDGHGGRHVSALCKESMHVIMEEELMQAKVIEGETNGGEGGGGLWRTAINRSFQRMDEMALRLCLCGSSSICRCSPRLSFMGSTAVVSILTKEYVFVANCGDSRAVLCRNGRPVPLSIDHKPDREDERARIEACGGRIMFADGARVEGILGMSRAIGDRLLKQWVTSEPEISITRREAGDECLIVGSDGLWDVLSSELACKIVHDCFVEHEHDVEPQIDSAATLLVRLALGRRSTDNISVIVIDLRN